MQELKIGQVAREAGVGVETVRYYQRQGLIEEPPRQGARRHYPPEAVARIRFIRGAQNVGFTLKEIEELLNLRLAPGTTKGDIKARAEAKVAEINDKMGDLQRMKDSLLKLIGACEGTGALDDCPILEAFDRGREAASHGSGTSRPRSRGRGAGGSMSAAAHQPKEEES